MSDLGAIFHVKKNGTQYDAHAYTTLAECPYPNLKIKTKSGTQAYVKLTTNGQGDVPFRVKPKSESTTYQVIASAVPTGGVSAYDDDSTWAVTIPKNVKVVQVAFEYSGGEVKTYVGVTPNKTYNLHMYHYYASSKRQAKLYRNEDVVWLHASSKYNSFYTCYIRWSPEINGMTPTVTDY